MTIYDRIYEQDRVPAILALGRALSTDFGKAMFLAIYEETEELDKRRKRASEFEDCRLIDSIVKRDNTTTWDAGVLNGLWCSFVAYIALNSPDKRRISLQVAIDHELYDEFKQFQLNATEEQIEDMRETCKMCVPRLKVRYR